MAVEVLIDPAQQSALHQKVLRASEVVRDVLEPSGGLVQAQWSAPDEPGPHGPRPAACLRLSTPLAGTVEAKFAPSELDSDSLVWERVTRALSELLRRQSQAHLQRLDALVKELGKD